MNPTPYVQASSNGRLHDAREASVSPLDRGFLYGDAVYEVWRTYHGVLFAFEEHWDRLCASAAALLMELPFSREELFEEIRKTAAAFRKRTSSTGELYVRLQVTRGGGRIGLSPSLAEGCFRTILVQDLEARTSHHSPLRVAIARNLRRNAADCLNPAWKTGNYLNNLLCLAEARASGADEVLILNRTGSITEASVCNVFFAGEGRIVTPPLSVGILGGITRLVILQDVAERAGLRAEELEITPDDIGGFDECFLSSSTRDVTPVGAVDEQPFRTGEGTLTGRLKAAFGEFAADYAMRRPELKV